MDDDVRLCPQCLCRAAVERHYCPHLDIEFGDCVKCGCCEECTQSCVDRLERRK